MVSAVLAAAALAACVGVDVGPAPSAAEHPSYDAAQTCTSCKDAPDHTYEHKTPYDEGECASCHIVESWTRITYVHETSGTVSPFDEGFHIVLGCAMCHEEGEKNPSPDCRTCHEPQHLVAKPCAACHNPHAWRLRNPLPKGHVSLANGHSKLNCFSCHTGKRPMQQPRRCVSCHGVQHGGLTECADCHDPARRWKPKPGFNHDSFFKIRGRHTRLQCADCHPDGRFAGTRSTCVYCHGAKHGGLTACSSCHTTSGFKPSTFDHSTRFVLRGAHKTLACTACHPKRQYANAIGDAGPCTNCHGSKHGGLTACASCHTTTAFKPSTFDHDTRYRLTGRHREISCSKCHPSYRYANVIGQPPACTNCHGVKHGNQTDCAKCHTTSGFVPAKQIDHPVSPALGGRHAEMACTMCHPTLVFNEPVKPCSDCHEAPHQAPSTCLDCHTPTTWPVEHDPIGYHTDYPITDLCQYCHTTGEYPDYRCDQCHIPL